ncbi:twin transmembrane helix small protein [Vogesella sp. LIG4]|uniref:twin transmembrane helix small protein n=1 Tax=Vogesella sp. LIG4 TaxID=1192162 RepID=UPI00081FFE81|nr:twin transmembrane helix small protein [Vogesella sp. LIG4]SCK13921.1 Protein of unknown function [Vogesella sp. LIG4]
MNVIVPLLLLLIIGSLAYALRSLTRGGDPRRTVKALTLRVVLSISLFALVMAGKLWGNW